MPHTLDDDELRTPAEAGALLRVEPQTLARWERAGVLESARTEGGHRRYWLSDLRRLADARSADV